jgi:hypothetical protein
MALRWRIVFIVIAVLFVVGALLTYFGATGTHS